MIRIEEHITRFLEEMDQLDKTEPDEQKISKAELQQRIAELRDRKVTCEGYLDQLEQTGETQILTTDSEARVMQSKGVLPACYEGSGITVEVQEQNAMSCSILNDDETVTCPMGKVL